MTDDYTPTTEEVRDWFGWDTDLFESPIFRPERVAAFDRWLATVTASHVQPSVEEVAGVMRDLRYRDIEDIARAVLALMPGRTGQEVREEVAQEIEARVRTDEATCCDSCEDRRLGVNEAYADAARIARADRIERGEQ